MLSLEAAAGAEPMRARARVMAEAAEAEAMACVDTGVEAVAVLPEVIWPAKSPRGSKAHRKELMCLGEERGGKAKL
jgi:hypothetical protein